MEKGDVVPVTPYYSAALDEIHWLRTLLALEAGTLDAHAEMASFPKSRRRFAAASIERMRLAARGGWRKTLRGEPNANLAWARREAGMPPTLTRAAWEAETFDV